MAGDQYPKGYQGKPTRADREKIEEAYAEYDRMKWRLYDDMVLRLSVTLGIPDEHIKELLVDLR